MGVGISLEKFEESGRFDQVIVVIRKQRFFQNFGLQFNDESHQIIFQTHCLYAKRS